MLHNHTVYFWILYCVQFSCSVLSNSATPGTAIRQPSLSITQLLELAQTHVHWVSDDIQPSSVVPFSSWLQSCPTSGSFQMSQFFTWGGESIGVSVSASVLSMNIQDWFPLGLTGWILFLTMGLSSLLQHHSSKASILWCPAFSLTLTSIQDYWKNHSFDYTDLCGQSNVSAF